MKKYLCMVLLLVSPFISSFVLASDEFDSFFDFKMDEKPKIDGESRDWTYFRNKKFSISRLGYESKATYCNDYPKCPEFKVIIYSDGYFIYQGQHLKFPYKNGKFEGRINKVKLFEILLKRATPLKMIIFML